MQTSMPMLIMCAKYDHLFLLILRYAIKHVKLAVGKRIRLVYLVSLLKIEV